MTTKQVHVIVGAGAAGARAAQTLRSRGFDGIVILLGEEPYPPYERPALSKGALLDPAAIVPSLLTPAFYEEHEIELELGHRAVAINPKEGCVELADGRLLAFDRLLLATGGAARRLPAVQSNDGVFYLKTLGDARALSHRMRPGAELVIVGGGFIGLEVAACAAQRGCRVTVVEAGATLLPRSKSWELGRAVLEYHQALGTQFLFGCCVRGIVPTGSGYIVSIDDGRRLEADLIVVGIGIVAEVELARSAQLRVNDGVVTNHQCATSDARIFAAGDVANSFNPTVGRSLRLESWEHAGRQGEAAALAMLGMPVTYAEVPWAWSDQSELNIQVAGAPLVVTHCIVRQTDRAEEGCTILQFDGERLVGGITLNRGREMPLIRRLLVAAQRIDQHALSDPGRPLRQFLTREPIS